METFGTPLWNPFCWAKMFWGTQRIGTGFYRNLANICDRPTALAEQTSRHSFFFCNTILLSSLWRSRMFGRGRSHQQQHQQQQQGAQQPQRPPPAIPYTAEEVKFLERAERVPNEFQASMRVSDLCWEKCVQKLGNKLESSDVTCLHNCAERYLDTTRFMLQLFVDRMEKQKAAQKQ